MWRRDVIIDAIWPDNVSSDISHDRQVNQVVQELRRSFDHDVEPGLGMKLIKTIEGLRASGLLSPGRALFSSDATILA